MSGQLPRPASPSGRVTTLRHEDVLRVDAEPLLRLRAVEGPVAAGERVTVAREVIAYRRAQLTSLHRACAFARLAREVRAIADVAGPIGLTDLTVVAGHVLDCLDRAEPAALGATLARLNRLCGQALDLTASLHGAGR